MAVSGAMNTDNTYIKYTIEIVQNSQNISNNTSNVTVKVRFYRTNNYTSYGTGTVYCKINGTTYSASVTTSQKINMSGVTLFTKTMDISHNTDGTKTLTCSAWISHDVVSSSEQSYSQTLTTIPRKSSMSVGNGTLGTAQTLSVTRQSTSFTHTVTYSCGTASGTIVNKGTSTSISFTPPLSLSSQNTTGTSVSIIYTITTYNGSTSVGSNSYTKTCSIPSSVAPSCSVAITDPTGYSGTYGGFIKGLSKFQVVVTPTTSYGSAIASYSVTANGSTYTTATSTTGVLKSSGTLTVTAKVTDQRGRSGSASRTQAVLDYTAPTISKLAVNRCNSDGTANDQGEYTKVTFSVTVTSLSSKNKATYILGYKRTSVSTYTNVTLTTLNNNYAVTNYTYVIPTSSSSSFNIQLSVTDAFSTVTKTTSVSTGSTLMHWLASGLGMAIGKVAELTNVFDIGFRTRFSGGILHPVIPQGTNLNDIILPNIYTGYNATTAGYLNCPITSGTFTLYVDGAGDGTQLKQKLVSCNKTTAITFERFYYSSDWGEWICTSDWAGKLLWSGGFYMNATQTATLSALVSRQPTGITLVWCGYSNGTIQNYDYNCFFVPKHVVAQHNGAGHSMFLTNSTMNTAGNKYVYIHDDKIVGHDVNDDVAATSTSGITRTNNMFVLRYVIGH